MRPLTAIRLAWAVFFVIAFVAITGPVFAQLQGGYPAKVVRVVDGDTLEVDVALWQGVTLRTKVRLVAVNTPESRAPASACEIKSGQAAKAFTAKWVASHPGLLVLPSGDDKYGRTLARLRAGSADLADELLAAGLARPYAGEKRGPWC